VQVKLGLFKSIEKIDAAIILAIREEKRKKSEYNVEWEEIIAKNLKRMCLEYVLMMMSLLACLLVVRWNEKKYMCKRRRHLFIHAQPCQIVHQMVRLGKLQYKPFQLMRRLRILMMMMRRGM
jgi:hypothetical protein